MLASASNSLSSGGGNLSLEYSNIVRAGVDKVKGVVLIAVSSCADNRDKYSENL